MNLLLVADIGGTNARFRLIDAEANGEHQCEKASYKIIHQVIFQCANFTDITSLLKACCEKFQLNKTFDCCLAIAGSVQGDLGSVTQLDWYFSLQDTKNKFSMRSLAVINDFAALAYAIPILPDEDLVSIYDSQIRSSSAPIAVIGPGTGFGTAILIPENKRWKVLPTAGGHASFSPSNSEEWLIKSYLLEKQSYVSIEDVLSGRGLSNIYQAIANKYNQHVSPYTSEDICQKGVHDEDSICREAILRFLSILGNVAGDKALSFGAGGGVVIGGGITPALIDFIPESDFLLNYHNKGVMTGYVKDIPLQVIANKYAAVSGATAWFLDKN